MDNFDTEKVVSEIIKQGEAFNDIEEDLLHDLLDGRVGKNTNIIQHRSLSFGEKMADKIAESVGSWGFIIGAVSIITIWIIINSLTKKPFDPFPFILLNLALSCIAALQAPVIMMSQNRHADKEKLNSKNDYQVNLKTEVIIQDLHKKMELLIENQNKILNK